LNPEIGTVSQGGTEAEAIANLVEATELSLEEFLLPVGQRPVVCPGFRAVSLLDRGRRCCRHDGVQTRSG